MSLPSATAPQAESAQAAASAPLAEGASASGAAAEALAEGANAAMSVPAFSWGGYFMSIALLCLLMGALWFALRFIKKRGGLRMFGVNDELAVESRLALGPKKNLLVVRLPGKRVVLGVTDHHISKLAELPLEDYEEEAAAKNSGGKKRRGLKTAPAGRVSPDKLKHPGPVPENFSKLLAGAALDEAEKEHGNSDNQA